MRQFHYRHLVTFDETNVVGNVYFAHHLRWQGHCRERFLAEYAPAVVKALDGGELVLVTLACAMNYYSECFALDEIDVAMSLRQRGDNRIVMDFDFRRDGRQIATGSQTVACLRRTRAGTEPAPVPADLAGALDQFA